MKKLLLLPFLFMLGCAVGKPMEKPVVAPARQSTPVSERNAYCKLQLAKETKLCKQRYKDDTLYQQCMEFADYDFIECELMQESGIYDNRKRRRSTAGCIDSYPVVF